MEITAKLEARGYAADKIRAGISRILSSNTILAMASTNEGKSHISTAFFCFDELLHIFVLNDLNAQHTANIAKEPHVALAIYDSRQRIDGLREGLQVFGRCVKAEGDLENKGIELYFARFPSFKPWLESHGKSAEAAKQMLYVVEPETLKLYDEPDFGHVFIPVAVIG
ncbi:MAG: pyridoxamine 5'-phosphate oxidase family protein [Candidatus Micrarchaeia archaeon]